MEKGGTSSEGGNKVVSVQEGEKIGEGVELPKESLNENVVGVVKFVDEVVGGQGEKGSEIASLVAPMDLDINKRTHLLHHPAVNFSEIGSHHATTTIDVSTESIGSASVTSPAKKKTTGNAGKSACIAINML
ncbi:tetratricopeptide repeat protein [Striga asiatica]|uniref:Tetratricopeptide repeat protein n=1 Tax=Striga asiatica TaxID=4170 RepID=A0A5A7PYD9_STRAF|nr:tetratricopeptide repeat protein [Striga asiatica]